jgi:glycosyltransferase involved in cell wall biosynthesis
MRIFVIGSAPKIGLLYNTTRMALEMARQGHEVVVATFGTDEQSPGLARDLAANDVRVEQVECLSAYGMQALFTNASALHDLIAQTSPDVIHVHGPIGAYQCGCPTKAIRAAMIANMGHERRWPTVAAAIGGVLLNRYSDVVIAQCEYERRRFEAAGIRHLAIVPAAIDCDHFLRQSQSASRLQILTKYGLALDFRYLGCFANLHPWKRQDQLIAAFDRIAARHPDWQLVLAGDGAARNQCVAAAESSGVRHRINFLGRVPNSDAAALLAAMDAVAHCSVVETFGYSIIEPLLLGKPAVFTRAGIAYELEKAGKAFIIPPDDLEQLTQALDRILRFDPEILHIARQGPDYIRQQFDVSSVAHRLLCLYAERLPKQQAAMV